MRKAKAITVFFLFLLSHVCFASDLPCEVCNLGNHNCVYVETVYTPQAMERGLMYRDGMAKDHGMLFAFVSNGRYQFWMKNMRFDLDLLWINQESKIIHIARNVPACAKEPCAVYAPIQDAHWVLELNSGYTSSHGWKVGDKVAFLSQVKGVS